MKKLITIIGLITLISLNTMSQDLKGKVLLSGMLGAGFDKSETVDARSRKYNYFSISTPGGYFVTNKLMVGVVGEYSNRYMYSLNKSTSNSYESSSYEYSYLIGPFVRSYFPINEKFMFFLHFESKFGLKQYEYLSVDEDNSWTSKSEKASHFNTAFYPGLSYRITNKLMIEAGFAKFSYSSSNGEVTRDNGDPENNKSSYFSFRANYLSFGLTLVL